MGVREVPQGQLLYQLVTKTSQILAVDETHGVLSMLSTESPPGEATDAHVCLLPLEALLFFNVVQSMFSTESH